MVEIAFTASRDYGNPFHDVTLDVLFDTPQGQTLKVPAFGRRSCLESALCVVRAGQSSLAERLLRRGGRRVE